jgi:phosphonate transport system substrate-binding protein
VLEDSPIKGYADMNGAKLGLLPRGSLVGFYLPLYNLYGVRVSGIAYGVSFIDLAEKLAAGTINAMAWDANQSQRPPGTRVAAVDPHLIPGGAMVMKSTLNSADYKSLLAVLDANAFQLPAFLGYSSGSFPDPRSYHHFTKIIRDVDSWTLPQRLRQE